MTRTSGDTTRRRALADAASGFPSRAAVVLYACIAPGQDQGDVMVRLRRYAEARDWVVAGEVVDHCATTTPLNYRRNWDQAEILISAGQARGIVASPGTENAGHHGSQSLAQWLHDQHAFLSEVPTAETGVVR